MAEQGIIFRSDEARRIQRTVEAHERTARRTLPPLTKPRVITSSGGGGGGGDGGVSECGCGERMSQAFGVLTGCASIASDYNAYRAFEWTFGDVFPGGAGTTLTDATVVVSWSGIEGEECIWRSATLTLSCYGADGTLDEEEYYFELELLSRSRTVTGETVKLHPEAVLRLVTSDTGDPGITCGYKAYAFCPEFNPLKGGLFTWQPGACLQVDGCFCIKPSTDRVTCHDCEQPNFVTVQLPVFGGTPTNSTVGSTVMGLMWPSQYSGMKLSFAWSMVPPLPPGSVPGPNDGGVSYGQFIGGPDTANPCAWQTEMDQTRYAPQYPGGSGWENWPATLPSWGNTDIVFKSGDLSSDWAVDNTSLIVLVYKGSDAATYSPAYASGGSGWIVAVRFTWVISGGTAGPLGSTTQEDVTGWWLLNTGLPESSPCVSGTFTLPLASTNGTTDSDAIFADTEVVVTIPRGDSGTDADGDGVPELQPCDSDAADDCGSCEWIWVVDEPIGETVVTITCQGGVAVVTSDSDPDLEYDPAILLQPAFSDGTACEGFSCTGYNDGASCTITFPAGTLYTGWQLYDNACGEGCVAQPPETDGAFAGEIQNGSCVKA